MKKDTILVVDDELLNRLLLEGILEVLGYECRCASSGVEALAMLDETIDTVLLDVNMPELTGFDVVRQIRQSSVCSDIPVVMVTALSSMQDRLAAVEAGANDFICKPLDQTELRIRIASQLRVKHAQDAVKRHQQGLENQVLERTSALLEANEKLAHLATTDPLTGLANHRSVVDSLDLEIARCKELGSSCSVLFIDVDHFKALNDSCGHVAGDLLLQELAAVLQQGVNHAGTCGRWGGEEFVCIFPDTEGTVAAQHAEELRSAVAQHKFTTEVGCHITCSIGVASFPRDGSDRSTLAEAADKAMYVAKSLGRNQVRSAEDVSSGFDSLRSEASSREDQALTGLVEALASLVSMREGCPPGHLEGIEKLAKQMGSKLGLSESDVRLVGIAGRLHDIGKVAIPDVVLAKGELLSSQELLGIQQHPIIGADVLARVPSLRAVAPTVRSHHESWDGTGYPDGLTGDEIPVAARIVAIVTEFCSLTAGGPHFRPLTVDEALERVRSQSGIRFDPQVVSAMEQLFVAISQEAA